MRPLYIIVIAATLTGCAAPQQASRMDSKTIAKSEKAITAKKESHRHRRNAKTHTKIAKSSITAKMETPLPRPRNPSQPDGKSNGEAIAAKTETSPSSQPDDEAVIYIAKLVVAEKMDNPASVVFLDMKRAVRKDALGNSIDTVCGHVRGKLGGDTGDRPFLYVVQKDKAYIGAYTIATSEYRNICQ